MTITKTTKKKIRRWRPPKKYRSPNKKHGGTNNRILKANPIPTQKRTHFISSLVAQIMNAFSSDSSRIALLGITFELSRYVAQEALRTISSAFRKRNAHHDHCDCKDGNRFICGACEQCDRTCDNIEISIADRFIGRVQHFNPIHRYLLLGSWLLLSPSILLLCSSKTSNSESSKATVGSTYLSSIVTSLGLLFCLYPELVSVYEQQNQRSVSLDENDSTGNHVENKQLQTPTKPPLPPLSLPRRELEEEYRPRSDSMLSQNTEVSTPQIIDKEIAQKQYLEILVHNISHTDLILGLSDGGTNKGGLNLEPRLSIDSTHTTPRAKNNSKNEGKERNNTDEEKYILCRPRFSAFDMFSRRIKNDLVKRRSSNPIISYPKYERANVTARYTLVTPRPGDQSMLPVGFNLEKSSMSAQSDDDDSQVDGLSVNINDMPSLRVRGRDVSKIDPTLLGESPRRVCAMSAGPTVTQSETNVMESLRINAVFFPLLSTLLPRWLGQIADKFGGTETSSRLGKNSNVKKVIVLVSGVGSPRNWTHSVSGNSTQVCSDLMELFIQELYPDVTVIKIHSQTNIFRYDENISFATQELMPCIDAYRDAHARSEPYPDELQNNERIIDRKPFNPDWRSTLSIAYSFADGSAARTHAIQSALRPYRPTYFHFWQLKTFWHATKVTTEDIEVHSFEEMETVPAIAVDMTSGLVQKVINEMKAFRKDFLETLNGDCRNSDLSSFWLRKSKKPVLAVLLVQNQNGDQVMYRGMNMEVSMPTGSLCAERNAIGTALAADPNLKRENLLMVAVLSVQLPPSPGRSFSYCRPTNDGLDLVEVSEKLKLQSRDEIHRSTSVSSIAEASQNIVDEWEMDIMSPPRSECGVLPEHMRLLDASSPSADDRITQSGSSTPKHHISLYKSADPKSKTKLSRRVGGISSKNKTQYLRVQSPEDINPLKPCGACNEWLKKIAESNPHFKVLTFTDELCKGVYVSPCQE